jgi:hypothetical protein
MPIAPPPKVNPSFALLQQTQVVVDHAAERRRLRNRRKRESRTRRGK